MIRIENFIQLKAFARQDALILSLLWIASFACVVMVPAGAYGIYIFFYASLVFALAQFAYFRFLDHGSFAQTLTDSMNLLMPMYEQNGLSKADVTQTISQMTMLTPIQWSFIFMMQNILVGFIISLPIAAICARRMRKQNNQNF